MSNTSTENNMGLYIWDQPTDVFKYNQLADNFTKIAAHDHSTGKGVPIPANGIANNAITKLKTTSDVTYAWQSSTTALPSSPIDDQLLWTTVTSTQEVRTGASSTMTTTTSYNTRWFFHYSAASSQWVFAGGSPMIGAYNAGATYDASSGPLTKASTVGSISLTVPYKGAYQVTLNGLIGTTAGSAVIGDTMFLSVGTSSDSDYYGVTNEYAYNTPIVTKGTTDRQPYFHNKIINVTSTGTVLQIYYARTGSGTINIDSASFTVTPIYVTL